MQDLEWLLAYELRLSARHRRFVSLVMLSPQNGPGEVDRLLDGAVRDSDVMFVLNGTKVVLMGETDEMGARRAVERYQRTIDGKMDVRYGISSFPLDGKAPEDLIRTADRRLHKARQMQIGSVVVEG